MKISFLKYYKDSESFSLLKKLGFDVIDIQKPENVDLVIDDLKNKNYNTIVMQDELASFSEGIVNKYSNDTDINIVIIPNSKRKNQ